MTSKQPFDITHVFNLTPYFRNLRLETYCYLKARCENHTDIKYVNENNLLVTSQRLNVVCHRIRRGNLDYFVKLLDLPKKKRRHATKLLSIYKSFTHRMGIVSGTHNGRLFCNGIIERDTDMSVLQDSASLTIFRDKVSRILLYNMTPDYKEIFQSVVVQVLFSQVGSKYSEQFISDRSKEEEIYLLAMRFLIEVIQYPNRIRNVHVRFKSSFCQELLLNIMGRLGVRPSHVLQKLS